MLIYSLLSQKIVVATGILFNISRMWKDEGLEDDSDSEVGSGDEERGNSQAYVTVEEGTQDLFGFGDRWRERS